MALRLSQWIGVGESWGKPNLERRDLSHVASQTACESAEYLASMIEREVRVS